MTGERGSFGIFAAAKASEAAGFGSGAGAGVRLPHAPTAKKSAAPVARCRVKASSFFRLSYGMLA
jgi:hypothetical protein